MMYLWKMKSLLIRLGSEKLEVGSWKFPSTLKLRWAKEVGSWKKLNYLADKLTTHGDLDLSTNNLTTLHYLTI